jgi:hypothetical protein
VKIVYPLQALRRQSAILGHLRRRIDEQEVPNLVRRNWFAEKKTCISAQLSDQMRFELLLGLQPSAVGVPPGGAMRTAAECSFAPGLAFQLSIAASCCDPSALQ